MEKSKVFTILIATLTIVLITVATIIKIYNNHIDNQFKVIEKEICEAVRECVLDNKCTSEEITINDLIENEYIDEQVNPITKETIDTKTVVSYKNNICNVYLR